MTNCKRYKVAAIDLGTVSSRLVLAQVEGGAIVESSKHTEITDLGEGVDAMGRFCEAAVERVLAACRMFVDGARAFGAACICTTCTSAAPSISPPREFSRISSCWGDETQNRHPVQSTIRATER